MDTYIIEKNKENKLFHCPSKRVFCVFLLEFFFFLITSFQVCFHQKPTQNGFEFLFLKTG